MKILFVHNRYVRLSGEEAVVSLEAELLREHGHSVETYSVSNEDLAIDSALGAVSVGASTVWSASGYRSVSAAVERFEPDLVHVHNFFPRLSPSVYWAAKHHRRPVVQTLHNYRLICANGLLMRDEHPCELCVGRIPLPALRYGCYRDSPVATLPIAAMQVTHRVLGSFKSKVDAYIALTEFSKGLFIRGGLPEDRVYVKPNFVPDVVDADLSQKPRQNQIVFVGRITPEKGVDLLLDAWQQTRAPGWRLLIVGDGPQRQALQTQHPDSATVSWAGWLERADVLKAVGESRYAAFSSKWYEGLPMSLVESLAVGTPAIVPAMGAYTEMVHARHNGLLFEPPTAAGLVETLECATKLSEEEQSALQEGARASYLAKYTAGPNYKALMEIYEQAIRRNRAQ